MNLTRKFLTFTSLSVPTQWQMTKAKRAYVKEHRECAVCGYKKKLEVHHILPVHIDISLSCEPSNFITLCRDCHFTFGHFHNFRTNWNPEIRVFAKVITEMMKETRKLSDVTNKEFKECWKLSNLQLLYAKENLIKSNKWE